MRVRWHYASWQYIDAINATVDKLDTCTRFFVCLEEIWLLLEKPPKLWSPLDKGGVLKVPQVVMDKRGYVEISYWLKIVSK